MKYMNCVYYTYYKLNQITIINNHIMKKTV